jgi:hypothetical protein
MIRSGGNSGSSRTDLYVILRYHGLVDPASDRRRFWRARNARFILEGLIRAARANTGDLMPIIP